MTAMARLNVMWGDYMRETHGQARQTQWSCEDGWEVIYTTTRVVGGKHDGQFLAILYKPSSKTTWAQEDKRVCGTRAEAKRRAVKWYREHSPKWNAKHPDRTT